MLSVIPLVAYNLVIDPYLVLRKYFNHMFICPNERYIKTDYILNNPAKYDSLLFGSSRVSQIPVEIINKSTGNRFYNMTYIAGIVSDHLNILKIIIKSGARIKSIIIGLDYYSFTAMPIENQIRNIMYPETLWDKLKFYYTYLSVEPDSGMLKEVKFDGNEALYDITGTGEYDFIKKERLLSLDPRRHEAKFKKPVLVVCTDQLDKTLAEIQEIIALCKKNNIAMTFFINPDYLDMYLCQDVAFINKVRNRLALITDFWDFSAPNSTIGNYFNFIDPIHYRKKVGAMIIEKMFHQRSDLPAEFGFLVTESNSKGYIERSEKDFNRYKKLIRPHCLPCPKQQ